MLSWDLYGDVLLRAYFYRALENKKQQLGGLRDEESSAW